MNISPTFHKKNHQASLRWCSTSLSFIIPPLLVHSSWENIQRPLFWSIPHSGCRTSYPKLIGKCMLLLKCQPHHTFHDKIQIQLHYYKIYHHLSPPKSPLIPLLPKTLHILIVEFVSPCTLIFELLDTLPSCLGDAVKWNPLISLTYPSDVVLTTALLGKTSFNY